MRRAKAKKKTTAIAKRKATPPAKRNGAGVDLLARAGVKKGIATTTSGLYFQALLPPDRVLWNVQRDRNGNVQSTKPYAPYELLVDNTHRRGVLAIDTEREANTKCKDEGCYNPDEGDVQHHFKAVLTLETGQKFTGHGEACRHNTTKITRKALPRMAETRAKARAMRDATNIGLACVVELDGFSRGEWREGLVELSNKDMEERTERAATKTDQGGGKPALPAPSETTQKSDKQKAMGALHAVAKEKDVNTIGMHAWIHKKANVASISDLNADALRKWAEALRQLEGDELEAFRQNCVASASGGPTSE